MSNCKCMFCGSKAQEYNDIDPLDLVMHVECPTCGAYLYQKDGYFDVINKYKNSFACYLYYNKNRLAPENKTPFCFIGQEGYYEGVKKRLPWGHHITEEEIKTFMPTTFSDTITRVLLNYAEKAKFLGGLFEITKEELNSSWFIRRFDEEGNRLEEKSIKSQKGQLWTYFYEKEYIEFGDTDDGYMVSILPNGWKRIEEFQLDNKNNKDVFVAMSFDEKTVETRECIKEAIQNAGYSAKFMDEIIHNKQIVPEMLRLIRECRFLILDITDPNYGAYYEAGYAKGLGKEVIISCKKDVYNKEYTGEEEKYKKYLKPHFDIAQINTLIWEDYDDYKNTLEQWIRAIIG